MLSCAPAGPERMEDRGIKETCFLLPYKSSDRSVYLHKASVSLRQDSLLLCTSRRFRSLDMKLPARSLLDQNCIKGLDSATCSHKLFYINCAFLVV